MKTYPVVDLFAGPGGLGEGFSAYRRPGACEPVFAISVSVEKETSAHRTLRFRAFFRKLQEAGLRLNWAQLVPSRSDAELALLDGQPPAVREIWAEASNEALQAELGKGAASQAVLAAAGGASDRAVLIGGPPCQAYSLVGRARNAGIEGYVPEQDPRHFLYQEYVEILRRLSPVAFVMENVKGMLSAKVKKAGIFARVASDLRSAGYELFAMAPRDPGTAMSADYEPADFVIRAEQFGVPQARHRVIILGVRSDVAGRVGRQVDGSLATFITDRFAWGGSELPVRLVLDGLPPLTSRLSRGKSAEQNWLDVLHANAAQIGGLKSLRQLLGGHADTFERRLSAAVQQATALRSLKNGPDRARMSTSLPVDLRKWLKGGLDGRVFNHEPRGHMKSDLARYLYAACFADAMARSPKAPDFPVELAPRHANWASGKFSDRFRVQVASRPATTITSHISKDGHYYIHPDPSQCRSLTVREAARIQTFPDDYIFFGNRTQQYVQVGNAVPPFLALRIARVVDAVLQLDQ